MDCTRVDEELVGFHLAAIEGATRAAVEAHLTGCVRCVSAYLALKRAADAGADAAPPSELTRARIRAAAARQLSTVAGAGPAAAQQPPEAAAAQQQPEAAARRRVALALVGAAAALLIAAPFAWRATHDAPLAPIAAPAVERQLPTTHEAVDTARATPENLSFL